MELIVFIQVFNIIVIAVGTLFYMCCRSLTFSSSSSSSAADSVIADSAIVDSVVADYAADSTIVDLAADSAGADYATDSAVADSVGADSSVVDYATDSVVVDYATDSAVADSVGADSVADSIVADSAVADSVGVDSSLADADIPPSLEKYDVFISFRGMDTRNIFTCHLYQALVEKKIVTYIDNRLQRGEEIGPALLKAIEKSKFWVIIFSKNYATSAWCLDELVRIIECNEKRGGDFVIPIFYHTNPSDVREQQGSYETALAQHQSIDKVKEWKEALTKAANRSGFPHPKNAGTDADLVKNVVKGIWTKLCCESSCDLKGLVGIKSRIEQIELLLGIDSPDDCITVGIWGMGGIGKTTLAKTIFHKLSSKFEGSCFLRDVTEREQKEGLDHLEKTLLKEILKEEDLSIGSTMVRERLGKTKVLIVLDDVSDSKQIERLVGNSLQFGIGSRIIITSRDKRTLRQTVEEEQIYEVKGLKLNHALQLFCSRAFRNNRLPNKDYKGLVNKAVDYAGRVPLALIDLGSSFSNCKSKQDWEDAFNKLKKFPCESILKVLGISYNRLEGIEKEIFLDIACFHKGWVVDKVERALHVRGFLFGSTGIRILIDMSLISIDSKWKWEPIEMQTIEMQTIEVQTIEMHDSLQEMGRAIVQKQYFDCPGKRSRLFTHEDVYDVLDDNNETRDVKAIFVNWSKIQKIQELPLERADFKVMSKLLMLIGNSFQTYDLKFTASLDLPDSLRYLYWWGYPLESLPSNFSPKRLVELHMPFSKVEKLWTEDQRLVNLKVIDLCFSSNLTQVPNISSSTKIVDINLHGCVSLVEITWSFQHLDKLTRLDLGCCTCLKDLPVMPANIECLNLRGCVRLGF
ncbi:disease resistance protein RPV1 [Pyrus x bretschneideri]|uniref:disease resistance protein RPV1 n=1 Tax=Pyrus x bretschneideri TaxID=225117 RepID=UPI00202EE468|nr:disease resistance protein RPV1 [Pyrus x bretschneideri]